MPLKEDWTPRLLRSWREKCIPISVTFDLENLAYISSAGLRVLLSAQKIMNKQGKMTIKNVCPEIMDIFDVTGFVDILNIEN